MDNITVNVTENIENITVNTTQSIDNITANITENVEPITINISSTRGDTGPQGEPGINGSDGEDGYTPIKGVDYFDGVDGTNGLPGLPGTPGSDGVGVPVGGTANQVLAKIDSVDFNTHWVDGGTGSGSGENGIDGVDGREVLLQKSSTHIQWKYDTDLTWNDLVPLSELEGATGSQGLQGIPGIPGIPGENGSDGYTPIKGIDYFDGLPGLPGEPGTPGEQGLQGEQGIQGIQGIPGTPGTNGTDGENGAGVPVGGTTGQVLAKVDAADFNTEWVDPPAGTGSGGAVDVVDLSSQIPATHFTTLDALSAGHFQVYYNGLLQEPSAITVDANGLGFTCVGFSPVAGDKIVISYGAGGGGIPSGGTTEQILSKIDNTDFSVHWVDKPTGGGGSPGYQTLTDGPTISWDLAQGNAEVILGGNQVMANPTNQSAGERYFLLVKQDATGTRSLSFGTDYKFPFASPPVLSKLANSWDLLDFRSNGASMLYAGIQRSLGNDFTPASIPGITFWLRADAITGLSDGTPVASWADVSGNNRNATQVTEANKPLYKTGILNNLPVLRFDGSNDILTLASHTLQSLFIVSRYALAGTFPTYKGLFDRGTNSAYLILTETSVTTIINVAAAYNNTWRNGDQTNNLYPINNWSILSVVSPGAITDSWEIGNDLTAAGRAWNGDIAEVIGYSGALTNDQRVAVQNYLNAKYSIF
jgi:hypothetical protein